MLSKNLKERLNKVSRGFAQLLLTTDGVYKVAFFLVTTGLVAGFSPGILAAVGGTGIVSLFVSVDPIKDLLKKWADRKADKLSENDVQQLASEFRLVLQQANLQNESGLAQALRNSLEANDVLTDQDLDVIEADLRTLNTNLQDWMLNLCRQVSDIKDTLSRNDKAQRSYLGVILDTINSVMREVKATQTDAEPNLPDPASLDPDKIHVFFAMFDNDSQHSNPGKSWSRRLANQMADLVSRSKLNLVHLKHQIESEEEAKELLRRYEPCGVKLIVWGWLDMGAIEVNYTAVSKTLIDFIPVRSYVQGTKNPLMVNPVMGVYDMSLFEMYLDNEGDSRYVIFAMSAVLEMTAGNDERAIQLLSDAINSVNRLSDDRLIKLRVPILYVLRGNLHRREDLEQSMRDYNSALDLDPDCLKGLFARSELNFSVDWQQGLLDCNRALELCPDSSRGYAIRALYMFLLGKDDLALNDCEIAIKLNPTYSFGYLARGLLLQFLGAEQRLILADYQKAADLSPKWSPPYTYAGHFFSDFGKYERALQMYDRAIAIDPTDWSIYLFRCLTQIEKGDLELATEDLDRVPRTCRLTNPLALLLTAALSYEQGHIEKAISDFSNAMLASKLSPAWQSVMYYGRGELYEEMEQYERSQSDYTKAIELDPSNVTFYISRGDLFHKLRKYEHAIDDYSVAIQNDQSDSEVYHKRGVAYTAVGRVYEAMDDYRRAIELNPSSWTTYTNLGMLYAFAGEEAQSFACYSQALALDTETVSDSLRELLVRIGNKPSCEGLAAILTKLLNK